MRGHQGTPSNFTAPEDWRVPDLSKSLIFPTPWSKQECQRPPVSPGGPALRGDTPASVCRIKTSFTKTLPPAATGNRWLFHVTSQTLLKKLPGQKPWQESWEQTEDHSNSALEMGATGLLWSLRVLLRHSWSMSGKIGHQETLFQSSLSKTVYYFHKHTRKLITEIFRYCQSLATMHLPIKQPERTSIEYNGS